MRNFIVLLIVFFVSPVFAGQWCEWSGSQGINCQSDSRGFIMIDGRPTRTPSIAHAAGWYEKIDTQPTIGADQTRDAEVWGFADNQISRTWTVRDLTTAELDAREASAMPISDYYIWKTLLVTGVITQQQAANNLPAELIDAYQARDRIENQ